MVCIKNWYRAFSALGLFVLVYPTCTMEEKSEKKSKDFFELPQVPLKSRINYNELKLSQLLNFSGAKSEYCTYLSRLQILANLLYMHHRSLSFFQNIQAIEQEALTVASDDTIKFVIDLGEEDKEYIQHTEKKLKKKIFAESSPKKIADAGHKMEGITTPEGKAAMLQLIPLTHKNENYEKYFSYLAELSNHENSEIVSVARLVRNVLLNRRCTDSMSLFLGSFLYSLLLLDDENIPKRAQRSELDSIMSQGGIQEKTEEKLKNAGLDSGAMQTVPQVMWLYSVLDSCKDYFRIIKNKQKKMSYTENSIIDEHIKTIIKAMSSVHYDYNLLYQKVIAEQTRILRNFSSEERLKAIKKYKAVIIDRSVKESQLPGMLHDLLQVKTEDGWIPLSLQQKKKAPANQRKSTKKTRRKRPHKTECSKIVDQKEGESQEKQISDFSAIEYDNRILRWFDADFAATQSQSSVVYHRANPLIDHFLKKLAKPEKRAKKQSDLEDTVYSLMGEIHYFSGKKQTVRFTCCIDPQGICYHRGFDKVKGEESLFTGNSYNVNFPPLVPYDTQSDFEEKRVPLQNLIKNPTYYENQFCIRMSDKANSIKEIILFKPLAI